MLHFLLSGIYILYTIPDTLEQHNADIDSLNKEIIEIAQRDKEFIKRDTQLMKFININDDFVLSFWLTLTESNRILAVADFVLPNIDPDDITIIKLE